MRRLLFVLRDSTARGNLWWDLKRVWYEALYKTELRELAMLSTINRHGLVETDRRRLLYSWLNAQSPYLHYELNRINTLRSFLDGDE